MSPSNGALSDLGSVLKAANAQVVATLVRVVGDIDRAEEASQEAMLRALKTWQRDGLPNNPVAWLVTVGRNYDLDLRRRESLQHQYGEQVLALDAGYEVPHDLAEPQIIDDDLLRLVFACCHPKLSEAAQIALTLKVILGFSVEEISRALLTTRKTMEKRITRAKQTLGSLGDGYTVPDSTAVSRRIDAVLRVIYLVFNEGYSQLGNRDLSRMDLTEEAIRLGRIVARLFRFHPEARSLLALMLLTAARIPARLSAGGDYVPLDRQDRSRWQAAKIAEGVALIDSVYTARHPPGTYQIQAAISSLHSTVKTAAATDWQQIEQLYERLEQYEPSPVVRVNRALAVARCGDLQRGLSMLDELSEDSRLQSYQPFHAALADLSGRVGQHARARKAYAFAIELSADSAERRFLEAQRVRLTTSEKTNNEN